MINADRRCLYGTPHFFFRAVPFTQRNQYRMCNTTIISIDMSIQYGIRDSARIDHHTISALYVGSNWLSTDQT